MQSLLRNIQHAVQFGATQTVRMQSPVAANVLRSFCTDAPSTSKKIEWIRLVDEHGKILGNRPKGEAEALATKKHMNLVLVEGQTSAQKILSYKLVSRRGIVSKPVKRHDDGPEVKSIQIGAKIAENDLRTKVKQMLNWVEKGIEVRVVILGSQNIPQSTLENVFTTAEKVWKDKPIQVLQKRLTAGGLKFNLLPAKKSKNNSGNASQAATSESKTNDSGNG